MVPPLKLVLPSISVSEVNNMICSPKLPSLSQSQGPTKPPPPRKPLPADPHGRRPSGDLPGPGAGIPPPVVPSR